MNKRFIEIKGSGTPNKGAELMLLAVLSNFSKVLPKKYFCSEPISDYHIRAKHCLYQRTSFPVGKHHFEWSWLARLFPSRILDRYGLVTENLVDVIIDTSGFAYGDQWGSEKAKLRLSKRISRWKSQGKIIILMPQAFGPFDSDSLRREMKNILTYADLVFARDKKSKKYLDDILPNKALLGPDFTNLVCPPALPAAYQEYKNRPCIIPNSKMVTMGGDKVGYINFIVDIFYSMYKRGEMPFILIHEGKDDLELAEAITEKLQLDVDIVDPKDALCIKSIIGACSFVVSSRFHGLVSALSQGVPVLATGWSHKYQELLDDYGVGGYLVSGNSVDETCLRCLDELLNIEFRNNIKLSMQNKILDEKNKSKKVWEIVTNFILSKVHDGD